MEEAHFILLYPFMCSFGEYAMCVFVFIMLIKCKCIVQYVWKMLRSAFFCDFRMVFLGLINHVDLFLISSGNFFWIYSYKSVLRFFFPSSKIIGNWEILQKLFLVSLTKLLYFPPFILTYYMWLFQTIRVVSEGNLVYRQKGRTHLLWGLITRRN